MLQRAEARCRSSSVTAEHSSGQCCKRKADWPGSVYGDYGQIRSLIYFPKEKPNFGWAALWKQGWGVGRIGEQPQSQAVLQVLCRGLSASRGLHMGVCQETVIPGYRCLLSISRVSFLVSLQFCCHFPRCGVVIMEYLSAQVFICILASTCSGLRSWFGLWPSMGWTVFILPAQLSDIWFSTGSEWIIGAWLSAFWVAFLVWSCLWFQFINEPYDVLTQIISLESCPCWPWVIKGLPSWNFLSNVKLRTTPLCLLWCYPSDICHFYWGSTSIDSDLPTLSKIDIILRVMFSYKGCEY